MNRTPRHSYYQSTHGRIILVWSGREPTRQECDLAVERQKLAISRHFPRQVFEVELGHLETPQSVNPTGKNQRYRCGEAPEKSSWGVADCTGNRL